MAKRKQQTQNAGAGAVWYRWGHPEYPDYDIVASSDILGIRTKDDRVYAGDIVPRDWFPSPQVLRLFQSGLAQVTPEEEELDALLVQFPAMRKYYGGTSKAVLPVETEEKDKDNG